MAFTPRSSPPPGVVAVDGPFTHELIHTRGIRLHAAVAGRPGDPLVILLHDSSGNSADFARCLGPLADAGFRVAAVDLRGYGMSDKPPAPAGFGVRTLVSDVAGVIPALGYDSAAVVGADVGGAVAWYLATTHPDRVSALVSVSAAHPVDLRRAVAARPWDFYYMLARHAGVHLPARLIARPALIDREQAGFLRRNTSAAFHRDPRYAEVADLRRRAAHVGAVAPSMVLTTRILLAPTSPKHMNAPVTAPTLLVHPPQSLWVRVNRRSATRIAPGVPYEAASVTGAKNLPHLETPDAFVETLADFLGRHV